MSETRPATPVEISVVVPAFNEAESLPEFLAELRAALDATGRSAEVLLVDDGSDDATPTVLQLVQRKHSDGASSAPHVSQTSSAVGAGLPAWSIWTTCW